MNQHEILTKLSDLKGNLQHLFAKRQNSRNEDVTTMEADADEVDNFVDITDSNPEKTFTYLAEQLGKRKIAFIFAREYLGADSLGAKIKKAFGGVYIANEKFDKNGAEKIIESGDADAVSFGVPYISNPDLVIRLAENLPLNETNFTTIYAQGAVGYSDYSFYK